MSNERLEMTIKLQVTEAQALAVEAMLTTWNKLASHGSSRYVAMYVDGDGNFKPKAQWEYSRPIRELTDELGMAALAYVKVREDDSPDSHSDYAFDFDPIAWKLRDLKEKESNNA